MISRDRAVEIVRFLVAGVINTAFGYGLYAGLIWLGLDRYAAQAIGYVLGTGFNYFTYSRGVFTGQALRKCALRCPMRAITLSIWRG
jgi:putative flippase GtrA